MSIELELNRIAGTLELIAEKMGIAAQQPAPTPKPRAAKKEKIEPLSPETFEDPGEVPAKVYTRDEVYNALRTHAQKNTAEKTKNLMVKYGARTPKVDEIPADKYPFLMAEIENEIA